MADREKIINHFQDAIEASGDNNKWRFVRVDVIEDAIELLKDDETQLIYRDEIIKAHEDEIERLNELLKEQEPVEPKVEPAIVPTFKVYSFGHCDAVFHLWRQKYCTNCGRKVKWDGADRKALVRG